MEKSEHHAKKTVGSRCRLVLRRLAVAALLCIVLAVWRVASDFPASLERCISKSLSQPGATVEVSGMSFSFFRLCLKADSFAVCPQQEPGRVALAVSGAELRLIPVCLSPDVNWLREVSVDSLEFDADALSSLSMESDEESETPDFGPIAISIRRAAGFGFEVRNLRGDVSSRNGTIEIENASVSFNGRGEHEQILSGSICIDPSGPAVEACGSGAMDFSKLAPLLRNLGCDSIAEELEKFEFPVFPPHVDVLFYWAPTRRARSLKISVKAGLMRYCGVRITEYSTVVNVRGDDSWSRVDADQINVQRPEGEVSSNFSIDINDSLMTFNCVSTIDPASLAAILGLPGKASLQSVEFGDTAEIRSSGTLDIGEGQDSRTSLRFSASVPDAMVHGISLANISVLGVMEGDTIDIPTISADVADGSLDGFLQIGAGDADNGQELSASLTLKGAQLSQLAGAFGGGKAAGIGGTLDAKVTYNGPLAGLGDEIPRKGSGAIKADLHDALLFRIPLFAGLTGVLSKYIPGVDFLVDQDKAHVRATLSEGRWNISSLGVSGGAFSIDGSGTAAADGTDLNIVARVRLLNRRTWLGRRLQFLLSPFSGLFGIRATGSLSSPHWASAPFSRSSAK